MWVLTLLYRMRYVFAFISLVILIYVFGFVNVLLACLGVIALLLLFLVLGIALGLGSQALEKRGLADLARRFDKPRR